jgi:WD40 repeat protein
MDATPASRSVDSENPWLGLESFTEAARDFFHGREDEIAELQRRVKSQMLAVLFGQSGLGKTSLLQAGLFPRLRRDAFFPIYLRLNFTAGAPALDAQVKTQIARAIADAHLDATHPLEEAESLWQWLHLRDAELCDLRGRNVAPALVFDQFEELFTLGLSCDRAAIDHFVTGLGDLAENRLPASVEALLESDPSQAARFDFRRADYRVLLSLREDFLPHLEELRAAIPSLMQNRMRLSRMKGRQALDAVVKPGGALVTPEVAVEIVRFVAGQPGESLDHLEVDPSLLSLVCHELNDQRRAADEAQITANLLAGSREAILRGFYDDCMGKQPPAVRVFVEDELVTDSGFRENIAVERARKTLAQRGAPADAIDQLVQSRLLRVEDRFGVPRVELTHDVLTSVVCASRATRRVREEKEALEQRQRETEKQQRIAEQQASEARGKLRALRIRAVLYGVLAIVAVAAAVIAIRTRNEATAAKVEALKAQFEAEEERKLAEKERDYIDGARTRYYVAQAAQSFASWEKGQIGRARDMLADSVSAGPPGLPQAGNPAEDLRSWEWYYVKGLCDLCDVGSLVIPSGKDYCNAVAFRPGEKSDVIATGGADGSVKLRNADTGKEIRAFHFEISYVGLGLNWDRTTPENDLKITWLHPESPMRAGGKLAVGDRVTAIANAAGEMIPTAKLDNNAFIELLKGKAGDLVRFEVLRAGTLRRETVEAPRANLKEDRGHSDGVLTMAFHPGGTRLLTVGFDGRMIVWNVETGEGISESTMSAPVVGLAFSPDGLYIAARLREKPAIILRPVNGDSSAESLLGVNERAAGGFAFSPDSKQVAVAAENGVVALWNLPGGKPLEKDAKPTATFTLADVGDKKCTAVAFNPKSRSRQLAALVGGYVRLVDLNDPAKQKVLSPDQSYANAFAYSADGRYMATTGSDGPVKLWDVATGKVVRSLNGHTAPVADVVYSPDHRRLVSTSYDNTLRVWDLTRATPEKYRRFNAFGNEVVGLALSPDGSLLACAAPFSNPPVVVLLDAATAERLATFPGHTNRLNFSPDGALLAVPETGGAIQLIDVKTRKVARKLEKHTGELRWVEFSADGKWLGSAGTDSRAVLWNVATGEARELEGHGGRVMAIVFSPDSRTVATATPDDQAVRLFDVASGKLLHRIDGRVSGYCLRFSPDGKLLLTGGIDGRVIVRESASGEPLGELTGHTAMVFDVAFTPDGRRCVTVSDDHTARLWDLASKRELFLLDDNVSYFAATFSPDGTRLITSGTDRLRFWDAGLLAAPAAHPTTDFYLARAAYFADLRQWRDAIDAYGSALKLSGQNAITLDRRGDAWAELGNWTEAAADYVAALKITPLDTHIAYLQSLASQRLGRPDDYRAIVRILIRQAQDTHDPDEQNRAAWACAVLPNAVDDPNPMVEMARDAVKQKPGNYACASTLGSILTRAGRHEEAIKALEAAMKLKPRDKGMETKFDGTPFDWVFLAISHARLGHKDIAIEYLDQTDAHMERVLADPLFDDPYWTWGWSDRCELDILRTEAKALIESAP